MTLSIYPKDNNIISATLSRFVAAGSLYGITTDCSYYLIKLAVLKHFAESIVL